VVLSTLGRGGKYDPFTDEWSSMPAGGGARYLHTAVWTGTEMIIFGGSDGNGAPLDTGGRYNPATDTWVPLPTENAPSPRLGHSAIWTGRRMLVWGGEDGSGNMRTTGRLYDPVTDRWTPMAEGGPVRSYPISAWTGSRWILYGGTDGLTTFADGAMCC
jgi:N-acetylneuraminic acid mutarotase